MLDSGGEWKRKLTVVWYLTHMVADDEGRDLEIATKLWNVGCDLVENEMEGMPLQRAALGLLGRLVKVLDSSVKENAGFREAVEGRMCSEVFCSKLVNALAAAHKSKSTREQWSKGVGTMLAVSNERATSERRAKHVERKKCSILCVYPNPPISQNTRTSPENAGALRPSLA